MGLTVNEGKTKHMLSTSMDVRREVSQIEIKRRIALANSTDAAALRVFKRT